MKLRVVGWVYPFYTFERGEASWAVRNAIIDEIRKRGYDFSGRSHQDYCCTPVLNNGKKYLFSARGWGDLMAEAHGYTGSMDYTKYDFPIEPRSENLPDSKLNEFDSNLYSDEYDFEEDFEDWFQDFTDQSEETRKKLHESYYSGKRWLVPETDLNERFELKVSQKVLDAARKEGEMMLPVLPELRYLDAGDTLILACEGERVEYTVLNAERKRDISGKKLRQLLDDSYDFNDREKAKRAREEIDNAKMLLTIKIEQKKFGD